MEVTMRRRRFLTGTAGAAAGLGLVGRDSALAALASQETGRPFTLTYAPHLGMFEQHAGADPIAQIAFMADMGFRAMEDNEMKARPVALQERIASEMTRRGMRMGVFVAHTIGWTEPNLTNGSEDGRARFLQEIDDSVEVARRVNATWMTVVPGHVTLSLDPGYQTAHVVEALKRAAAILEPHGLVMVLESLNPRDHPGQFLTRIAQAYAICQAVDSPACRILDDLYHQQITEGDLIPNIDAAWDEIAYVQMGDNPGRNEPTTGEINYANVFAHIREKGYAGVLGMEHGNARPGRSGERAVIDAYRAVDPPER
jgi:hydroxypyruvate isomerase